MLNLINTPAITRIAVLRTQLPSGPGSPDEIAGSYVAIVSIKRFPDSARSRLRREGLWPLCVGNSVALLLEADGDGQRLGKRWP